MNITKAQALSKVPAVTLGFWVIKILATTLGETGGDAVSMSWLGETTPAALQNDPPIIFIGTQASHLLLTLPKLNGYLVGTAIFGILLAVLVWFQIMAKSFKPWLYWPTIIASTMAGTTMADYATRSLGIGYTGGSLLLLSLVLLTLLLWFRTLGTISVESIITPKAEAFYWATITFSQTLGTALGDWAAALPSSTPPGIGLGYLGGALLFGGAIAVLAALYRFTSISRVALFWAAFILTRPLGATVGDFLDKPLDHGGLALSRPIASLVLLGLIAALIWLLPQRAGEHPKSV